MVDETQNPLEEMIKHKLIYIEWEDAKSSDKWVTNDEMMGWADERYLVKQVGFVFKETKDLVILFAGAHDECDVFDTQYHQAIKIPNTWIRKRIDLTKHIK